MIDLVTFNNTVLHSFGEVALFDKTGGGVLEVNGIFDRIVDTNTIGYIPHSDASFTLTVRETDIEDYKIEEYKSVTVRGYKYQILEIDIDQVRGLAVIKLRRFR